MKLIDISIPVYNGMRTWPGVKPVEMNTMADKDFRTTRMNISTHTGTHVDYPAHMTPNLDLLPEERLFWGPVYLASPMARDDQRREITELPQLPEGIEGIIINTDHQPLRGKEAEFDTFYGLHFDLVTDLLKRKLKIIAIDSPSVESATSIDESVSVHSEILGSRTLIMENLDLTGVEDGLYELVVLPVKFEAVDGAPARAVLRKLP